MVNVLVYVLVYVLDGIQYLGYFISYSAVQKLRNVFFCNESYLVPRSRFDFHIVVEPGDAGYWFGLYPALEDEPFAIILLSDGRFPRERRCFTVHLSGN